MKNNLFNSTLIFIKNNVFNIFTLFVDYSEKQLKNFLLLFDHPLILKMAFFKTGFFKTKKKKNELFNESLSLALKEYGNTDRSSLIITYSQIVASLRFVIVLFSFLTFLILVFDLLRFPVFSYLFLFLFLIIIFLSLLFSAAFNILSYLRKI